MVEGVEIEVCGYIAYEGFEKNKADVLKLERVIFPDEPRVSYNNIPVPLDEKGDLQLTDTLMDAYNQFASTHNETILHTLDPFSLFLFYFHAGNIRDYETQYALFNDNPEVEPVFATVNEYIQASEDRQNMAGWEELYKQVISSPVKQVALIGEDEAVITISEETGLAFRLVKNHKGIWKVGWLPIQ
ncbi:hypothetical protein [Bacillus sp. FJAT-27445]|uniref:hypothetical protein n=1 Tax=Bacillus sp. FJAT-27445 TaxID=1679166 RepID=UPI000743229C|nr:hypothetical protein [Bacillus sp. FJAT-27445]